MPLLAILYEPSSSRPITALLGQAFPTDSENTKLNPDNVGAASTDYLHLFGLTALAYMWARMAKAVLARQTTGTSAPELDTKLALAKFFYGRLLPQAGAHLANLTSGAEPLMALSAEAF